MIYLNMLTVVQGWEIEATKLVIDLQVDKAKTKKLIWEFEFLFKNCQNLLRNNLVFWD